MLNRTVHEVKKERPQWLFGIRDWSYLKAGIREFSVRRGRDAGMMLCRRDTGIGDFKGRDTGLK